MRRGGLLAAILGIASAASVAAADLPNIERGRALYENHCVVCHTSKVHRRYPPSAIDLEALRYIVKVWVEEQNLRWSDADIEDVVRYLDSAYYRFDR